MQIQEMKPDDLIRPSWLDSYEKEIEALWWQLVQLNSNVFILEKLSAFPFDLFQIIRTPFWELVRASLFETSVMIIWRLVDPGEKTLTLAHFKDRIRENLREEEYCSQFDELLEGIDFEGTVSNIRLRVQKIRHNQLAHFQRKWIVDPSPEQMKERSLPLSDLGTLRDALNSLFDLLCFGHMRSVLLFDYDPKVQRPAGSDSRSDIERLLDSVAKESPLLNMPEEQPEIWPYWRDKNMSQQSLEVLNQYRLKFGLPKV